MFQAGQISMYYNVALSVYFLLIIKHNWNDRQFQTTKWIAHGTLLFVGLVLSFAAIPFIERDYRWCYIGWPPIGTTYTPGIVFFILPVGISILVITVLTAMLVCFVWKVEGKTARRSVTFGTRESLASKTLWQSIWFLLAFYIVWPVTFSTYIMPMRPDLYWWYVIAAILSPAQGFFNACIFFSRHRRKIQASVAKAIKINKLKERYELSNSKQAPSRNLALSFKLPMASSKKFVKTDPLSNVSEEAPAAVPSGEPELYEQVLKDESVRVEDLEQSSENKSKAKFASSWQSSGAFEHAQLAGLGSDSD